jgi:hypothetical protein
MVSAVMMTWRLRTNFPKGVTLEVRILEIIDLDTWCRRNTFQPSILSHHVSLHHRKQCCLQMRGWKDFLIMSTCLISWVTSEGSRPISRSKPFALVGKSIAVVVSAHHMYFLYCIDCSAYRVSSWETGAPKTVL